MCICIAVFDDCPLLIVCLPVSTTQGLLPRHTIQWGLRRVLQVQLPGPADDSADSSPREQERGVPADRRVPGVKGKVIRGRQ